MAGATASASSARRTWSVLLFFACLLVVSLLGAHAARSHLSSFREADGGGKLMASCGNDACMKSENEVEDALTGRSLLQDEEDEEEEDEDEDEEEEEEDEDEEEEEDDDEEEEREREEEEEAAREAAEEAEREERERGS